MYDYMPANETLPKRASLIAAVGAAIAASACCLGPVCIAALGVGGAGAFAWFARYRPMMLGVTAVSLAVAFYLSYRKPRTAAACDCGSGKNRRMSRVALWIVTALTVSLAFAPTLLAKAQAQDHGAAVTGSRDVAAIHVDGIDCEACAGAIRRALRRAGGFVDMRMDVKGQSVSVSYEPGDGRPDTYVAAIETLGYDAHLVEVRRSLP